MNKHKDTIIYKIDGEKAVTLWGDEGWVTSDQLPDRDSATFLAGRVAIVFRGMDVRANAVASIPFDIIRKSDGKVIDSSTDYKNELGFIPNPSELFKKLEMSLTLYGKAYIYDSENARSYPGVFRYILPTTTTYDAKKDLFTRKIDSASGASEDKVFQPAALRDGKLTKGEKIVSIWQPDPDVEHGPPMKSPGGAALAAMGVLFNLDMSTIKFFKNGMLHTQVFAVKGGIKKEDKEEFEERLNSTLRGIKNAWRSMFINAEEFKPVDIGGGLEELENIPLSKEKREDVAIALGIPMTKLFTESAAGLGGAGVSNGDDRRMISDTALPEFKLICQELNRQVLDQLGYRIIDRHETMEVFQENKQTVATSLSSLTTAFKAEPEMAVILARHLGLKLSKDDERQLIDIATRKEEQQPDEPQQEQAADDSEDDTEDPRAQQMQEDLAKFRRKAMKSPGKVVRFESEYVPQELIASITSELGKCKTEDDVKSVFDRQTSQSAQQPIDVTEAYRLTEALNRANNLLERVMA